MTVYRLYCRQSLFTPDNVTPETRQHIGPNSPFVHISLYFSIHILYCIKSFSVYTYRTVNQIMFFPYDISKQTYTELEMLLDAFSSSCIDYWNSLFSALNKSVLSGLRSIAAASATLGYLPGQADAPMWPPPLAPCTEQDAAWNPHLQIPAWPDLPSSRLNPAPHSAALS